MATLDTMCAGLAREKGADIVGDATFMVAKYRTQSASEKVVAVTMETVLIAILVVVAIASASWSDDVMPW
ncbi:hypothetical protein LCGC14_2750670 [marine sediment metagenome]|uniref:Uncharacterized protein n=1 Tax=marine sediment metagenome TaxID=412755 RepID=A0A0F8ZNX1_9ZZZZ